MALIVYPDHVGRSYSKLGFCNTIMAYMDSLSDLKPRRFYINTFSILLLKNPVLTWRNILNLVWIN